jgi:hypothetical protein
MERFQYFAFISYSRKDEYWAKWLHKKLETYKLPSIIRKEYEGQLPDKIHPVFLDKTDIGLGSLKTNLKKELEDSRYLIVICSPSAANSEWVNTEVEHFKELGREDRIIPFIIEGTPQPISEKENQCYPPALEKSILGASLVELPKEQAFIKIVASLLGLKFDELWNREKRRNRKKKLLIHSFLTFFLIVIATSSFLLWNYYKTTTKYYVDYVDRWGIPCGVIELSKDQVSKRNSCYKFEFNRGRLRTVEHINSSGFPTGFLVTSTNNHPLRQHLFYNEETGALTQIDFINNNDSAEISYKYSGSKFDEIDIKDFRGKDATLIKYIPNEEVFNRAGTELRSIINHYSLTRNIKGEITQIKYKSGLKQIADADGVYGLNFRLDTLGRILQSYKINANEEITSDKQGISNIHYDYDNLGNIKAIKFLNEKDSLQSDVNNTAEKIFITNNNGNIDSILFNDITGNPRKKNPAIIAFTYDTKGNLTTMKGFTELNHPFVNSEGICETIYKNDESGNVISEQYFDDLKSLCINKKGYNKIKMKYDNKRNLITETYFGLNGVTTRCKDGYSTFRIAYNGRGNAIEYSFWNEDGEAGLYRGGYSKMKIKFDSANQWTELKYIGINDSLYLTTDGFAKITAVRDNIGNIKTLNFFGINETSKKTKNGYASRKMEYDETGNIISESYFDINGSPCIDINGGYSKIKIAYDSKGNRIEESYFTEKDEPSISFYNNHKAKYYYSNNGQLLETSAYGRDGNSCLNTDLYSKAKYKYDSYGNNIEIEYLDRDSQLCTNFEGYAIKRMEYDNRGNLVKVSFFDTKNRPVATGKGFSFTNQYDNKDNLIEVNFLDTNNNLYLCKDSMAIVKFEYDSCFNNIYEKYFGVTKKPCTANYGYSILKYTYNNMSLVTSISVFDTANLPCVARDVGYSKAIFKYNSRGQLIEKKYY